MEQVLVVQREKIEQYISGLNGLITERTGELFDIIKKEHEFMLRPEAEERPDFKQIIPYVILRRGNEIFVSSLSLSRLRLGITAKQVNVFFYVEFSPISPTCLNQEEVDTLTDVFAI